MRTLRERAAWAVEKRWIGLRWVWREHEAAFWRGVAEARGWTVEGDGWIVRPYRPETDLDRDCLSDSARCFVAEADEVAGERVAQGLYLFCQTGQHAMALDRGHLPEEADARGVHWLPDGLWQPVFFLVTLTMLGIVDGALIAAGHALGIGSAGWYAAGIANLLIAQRRERQFTKRI